MKTTPAYFNASVLSVDSRLYPVEQVSWHDVQSFIAGLNELEKGKGYTYRLSTEAEWEYAARGGTGTQTTYFFGEDANKLGDYAWFSENAGEQTHPVKQLKPNPFGLYDILGNVGEWTGSDDAPYSSGEALKISQNSSKDKSLRGCAWNNGAGNCRLANRYYVTSSNRNNNNGFRLVAVSS